MNQIVTEPGVYTVTVNNTCGSATDAVVIYEGSCSVYFPTAFTPNNDGQNDLLRPILRGVKELRYFRIYNRWGNLLYEMNAQQRGWDGTLNGVSQQSQTVVWMLEGLGLDGEVHQKKGTTVLVR